MFRPNPERRINIKHLTVEAPKERDMTFDLARDITEEDWKGMKQELERLIQRGTAEQALYLAKEMKILNPALELGIGEAAWAYIEQDIRSAISQNHWGKAMYLSTTNKTFYQNQKIIFY